MAWATLANADDVRKAGNLSDRVDVDSLQFYLDIASYYMVGVVGSTNYSSAMKGDLDAPQNDMLRKAEACVAVAFALPAVGIKISEMGAVKQMAMARGGEYQNMSITKEIMELASSFMNMANFLIPSSVIVNETAVQAWYHVVQTVFPSLSEFPTRADIKSYEEEVIQYARGLEEYRSDGVGEYAPD